MDYISAFIIDNHDWQSGKYSTCNEITIRILLKLATLQDEFSLAIEISVLFLTFVILYIVNSKSDVLFGESTSLINTLYTQPALF